MMVNYLERLFIEQDVISRLCHKAIEADWPSPITDGLWELHDELSDEIDYQSRFDYNHL